MRSVKVRIRKSLLNFALVRKTLATSEGWFLENCTGAFLLGGKLSYRKQKQKLVNTALAYYHTIKLNEHLQCVWILGFKCREILCTIPAKCSLWFLLSCCSCRCWDFFSFIMKIYCLWATVEFICYLFLDILIRYLSATSNAWDYYSLWALSKELV